MFEKNTKQPLGCYLLLPAYYRKFQGNFEETLTEISCVVKKIMDDIAYNIGFKFSNISSPSLAVCKV